MDRSRVFLYAALFFCLCVLAATLSCASSDNFAFRDAAGAPYTMTLNPDVERHDYKRRCFQRVGDEMRYVGDRRYTYRLGVDISRHDGEVDWQQVRDSGREFVILRIGYRGYQSGILKVDERFHDNIAGAQAAGLDVGVYVFSQAVTETEAEEEADMVLRELADYTLQLPVVFDPEHILNDDARTDEVSGEQFTRNTIVFCEKIRAAGYEPMIYSNMLWEAFTYDLPQLGDYLIWYADYEDRPQTPYRFTFWQYSDTGTVPGCTTQRTDLDIQLLPVD